MKRALLLLSLCLYFIGCSHIRPISNPNRNWDKVPHKTTNSIVAIVNGNNWQYCSGVLITRDLVLTAAHCLSPFKKETYVLYGCTDVEDVACFSAKVTVSVPHPSYHEDKTWNDLGLLKLDREIHTITPAIIADNIDLKADLLMAGFGRRNGRHGVLYAGISNIDKFTLYEIYTGVNGENGPCVGDSGGPSFIHKNGHLEVIGILSRSYRGDNDCSGIAIYTVPFAYKSWINKVNKELNKPL